jgi:hypothetical protein
MTGDIEFLRVECELYDEKLPHPWDLLRLEVVSE